MGDRLSAMLLVLVLGLTAAVLAQLRPGAAERTPVEARSVTEAIASAGPSPAPLPALVDLTETLDRPVFSPTRRPTQAAAAAVLEAPPMRNGEAPPPDMKLSAVVIDAGRRFALLQRFPAGGTVRVAQGDVVDGWTLSEVRADGVTLRKNDQRHEIVLRTFEPAPVAPRRAGQRDTTEQAAPVQRVVPRIPLRRPLRGPRRPAPVPGASG
jgi:general secretion pathway protein N